MKKDELVDALKWRCRNNIKSFRAEIKTYQKIIEELEHKVLLEYKELIRIIDLEEEQKEETK